MTARLVLQTLTLACQQHNTRWPSLCSRHWPYYSWSVTMWDDQPRFLGYWLTRMAGNSLLRAETSGRRSLVSLLTTPTSCFGVFHKTLRSYTKNLCHTYSSVSFCFSYCRRRLWRMATSSLVGPTTYTPSIKWLPKQEKVSLDSLAVHLHGNSTLTVTFLQQWGTADAEIKDLSVENPELKGYAFKVWSRS